MVKLSKLSKEELKVLTRVLLKSIFPLDGVVAKESLSDHVEASWESLITIPDGLRDKLKELNITHYKLVSDTNYSQTLHRAEIILKIADKE